MDVKISGLSKEYGTQKAVDDISFHVNTGEVLGFLGPNGAGKTTTMKMIACLMAPNTGDVTVGSDSVITDPQNVKRNIGYLPENNPLYEDMPVMDYLNFTAALQGVPKDKIDTQTRKMIVLCGLDLEKHKKIGELSKGYRQRVGLAQAMIHDPEVLILDEPTTGLDPNQIVEIRKLIKELGKEKTVILSTHILPEVEATCDRILIINRGKIVADGTADSLKKRSAGQEVVKVRIEDGDTESIRVALADLPTVEMVDPIPETKDQFEVQSKAEMSAKRDIFNLCVKNKWALTELTPLETRLEDIFRDLTLN